MKLNKLFELATTSLLLVQTPGVALSETLPNQQKTVEGINYIEISDGNELQPIKKMTQGNQINLLTALNNSRVAVKIKNQIGSATLCKSNFKNKDESDNTFITTIRHVVENKQNKDEFEKGLGDGTIVQLTSDRPIRSNYSKEAKSDFGVVMPLKYFNKLGGKVTDFYEPSEREAREIEMIELVGDSEISEFNISLNGLRKDMNYIPCNFGVIKQSIKDLSFLNESGVIKNQFGTISQATSKKLIRLLLGDSGSTLVSLDKKGKPIIISIYQGWESTMSNPFYPGKYIERASLNLLNKKTPKLETNKYFDNALIRKIRENEKDEVHYEIKNNYMSDD
jgi:hypothetical protein